MDIPFAFDEQTELEEPIKVQLTGRMRDRINERVNDYVDRPEPTPENDPFDVAQYRAFTRQKTNIVIKTVEEAYTVYSVMGHYSLGAHWMNGMMQKAAKRVRREVKEGMCERGYEPQYNDGIGGRTLAGFKRQESVTA